MTASFMLNGKPASGPSHENLMRYLRETAGLTSVKNGCGSGVCGACTVLMDGKSVRSCRLTLEKAGGHSITTLEGLSQEELSLYIDAFCEAGAVQCGFCTPGMVLAAKALLDQREEPIEQEIKKALRNNLCRCTGYVKIIKAVQLAAKKRRDGRRSEGREKNRIGDRALRCDGPDKVSGAARYADDYFQPGMLHVKVLRAAYPRARVLRIDTEEARRVPGVVLTATAEDVPGQLYVGHVVDDWPMMVPVGECTRCVGDAIAMAAAETEEAAEAALERIRVEYEPLPPVTSPREAMKRGAPQLHKKGNILAEFHFCNGDPENASAKAAYSARRVFHTPFTEHAFLEPESASAWYKDGRLIVISASQDLYHTRDNLAKHLGLCPSEILVRSPVIGGGFGGKEDLSAQHFAALAAFLTKRPAKMTFTREESIRVHPKRHPMEITLELSADAGGNFTAVTAELIADTGAYASLGGGVMKRACAHIGGPYRVPNIRIDGKAVYTNNPPAGAFRGFGVAQSCFAVESLIDILAKQMGWDPWELRRQNALRPGDVMPLGQICGPDTAITEVLDRIKPCYDAAKAQGKAAGLACAVKSCGMGNGMNDVGRVDLRVFGGRVLLLTAAQCIGQGLATVMKQIVSDVSGVPYERIDVVPPDTDATPPSGPTTASRQTHITGGAARSAALSLKEALEEVPLEALEGRSFHGELASRTAPPKEGGHPRIHSAYSYAANLAVLDGQGRVEQVTAVHDVGLPVNPLNLEGQIEGGAVMGLGFALTENLIVEDGYIRSKFGTLGLMRATDIPKIEALLTERKFPWEACGPKGVGEISCIPTAAAVANAYFTADGKERLSLPLRHTPYSRAEKGG